MKIKNKKYFGLVFLNFSVNLSLSLCLA
jgi:hypothetical protein